MIVVLFIIIGLWMLTTEVLDRYAASKVPKDHIEVVFLDIGQGDATFITFEDGQQMLVDCAVDARILEALGRHMPFYDRTLDYLVVTHPDLDHYGGCIDVINRFHVREIITTGVAKENGTFSEFIIAASSEDADQTVITEKQTWQIGGTMIDILFPDRNISSDSSVSSNNGSLVMRLEKDRQTLLITADAEEETEQYLAETYPDAIDVDVLKAGHHGAANASSRVFLEHVTPVHAVISSGKDNSYGHPSGRVLSRLERVSSTIWRTDLQGDILLRLGEEIDIYASSD